MVQQSGLSKSRALVYPELLSDASWVKHSLLYWDELRRFNLQDWPSDLTGELYEAAEAGLITDITVALEDGTEVSFLQSLDPGELRSSYRNMDQFNELLNLYYDHMTHLRNQPLTQDFILRYPKEVELLDLLSDTAKKEHTSRDTAYRLNKEELSLFYTFPMLLLATFYPRISKTAKAQNL